MLIVSIMLENLIYMQYLSTQFVLLTKLFVAVGLIVMSRSDIYKWRFPTLTPPVVLSEPNCLSCLYCTKMHGFCHCLFACLYYIHFFNMFIKQLSKYTMYAYQDIYWFLMYIKWVVFGIISTENYLTTLGSDQSGRTLFDCKYNRG
jgi:hypothetical protein